MPSHAPFTLAELETKRQTDISHKGALAVYEIDETKDNTSQVQLYSPS